MEMCLAISVPRFTASSLLLLISTRIDGLSMSATSTLRPAASKILPSGAKIRPEFSTRGATSSTSPPNDVRMLPSLRTAPAPGVSPKRSRLFKKSSLESLSVEATRPATSTCEPAPNTMPLGLIKNTRPLDCSLPKISDGFSPTTRLSTWLAAFCCTKRVSSSRPMLNCCQLMMVPGVLVMVSVLPLCRKLACPFTTCGVPLTWAWAPNNVPKATLARPDTANAPAKRRSLSARQAGLSTESSHCHRRASSRMSSGDAVRS